ncbi:hypothetical protein WA556_007006, partial [Blastocystis sp. ATCC 50177/Nand II]
ANINEEFSAIQLSLISAQRDLERIDKPETPYEELHSFDEVLRSIQSKLKALSSKIKADRSPNKQIWQRRISSTTEEFYSLRNQYSRILNAKRILSERSSLLDNSSARVIARREDHTVGGEPRLGGFPAEGELLAVAVDCHGGLLSGDGNQLPGKPA